MTGDLTYQNIPNEQNIPNHRKVPNIPDLHTQRIARISNYCRDPKRKENERVYKNTYMFKTLNEQKSLPRLVYQKKWWWRLISSFTHCSVEKMRMSSLVFMVIIGKKTEEQLDWSHVVKNCIIPDHAGISYANSICHMRSMSDTWVFCFHSDKLLICQYVRFLTFFLVEQDRNSWTFC